MANDYNDKVSRVLSLYQRLMEGKVVDKEAEAARYGVSARSIQRDISAINNFFEQETEKSGVINSFEYDKKRGGHYLSQIYRTRLTNRRYLQYARYCWTAGHLPEKGWSTFSIYWLTAAHRQKERQ